MTDRDEQTMIWRYDSGNFLITISNIARAKSSETVVFFECLPLMWRLASIPCELVRLFAVFTILGRDAALEKTWLKEELHCQRPLQTKICYPVEERK